MEERGPNESDVETDAAKLRAELDAVRAELAAIHGSRLWKTADLYWRARRHASAIIQRLLGASAARRAREVDRAAAPPRPSHSARPAPPASSPPSGSVPRAFRGMASLPGRCNICGERTSFFYRDPTLFRESLHCEVCKATSRYRSIARGLLRAADLLAGVRVESLAALASATSDRRMAVLDTQAPFYFPGSSYPVPDLLARADWIDVATSRYDPDERPGVKLGGRTTNQNLEKLTFPDRSFDVLVTSDVLEHVRRDDLAFAEIRRVLKPGGVFLFTVPHYRDRETQVRVRVTDPNDPSRDEYLLEPEYHVETSSGEGRALAYRAYGTDLDERLRALGFDVEYTAAPVEELGIRDTELFFCRRGTDR